MNFGRANLIYYLDYSKVAFTSCLKVNKFSEEM